MAQNQSTPTNNQIMKTWKQPTEDGKGNVHIYEFDEDESAYTSIRVRETIADDDVPLVIEMYDGEERVKRFVFEREQRQYTGVRPQYVSAEALPTVVDDVLHGLGYTAVDTEKGFYG
jgi:hypothetical protein